MALQLILGSSGTGKSHYLYHHIIQDSIKNPKTNYMVIVPEQFTMSTQKDFVAMHPNGGIMNIDILSFMRLAYRIFEEVGGENRPVLEDTGKTLVLRRVLEEKKEELCYFKGNIKKYGFVDEIKSLLSELFQYSIGVEDLEHMIELAEGKPMLERKLQDVLVIYKGFKDYLKERYITTEEIMDVLSESLEKSQLIRNSVICLDGFTGFTPSQYMILEKLLLLGIDVYITVTIDEREDISRKDEEFKLFHLSKKTIRKLYDLAGKAGVEVKEPIYPPKTSSVDLENLSSKMRNSEKLVPYRFVKSPALAALEHNLFRYPYKTYEEETKDITIHSLKNAKDEVEFTIREILHLVREEGLRYREIAVVTGDIGTYGRIIEQEYAKAGIPCFLDNKRAITSNPYVKLLNGFLELYIKNFDYESVFHYLKSGMAGFKSEEVDLLDNYVLACGIKGAKKWSEPFVRLPQGMDEEKLIEINQLRERFMEKLLPMREIFGGKAKSVGEYTKALYEFSLSQGIYEKLSGYRKQFEEQGDLLSAKEYGQVYTLVMEVLERLVRLLGEEVLTLKEYKELLDTGFREAKVGLIPSGIDQIVVGDIERTRLKDIKVLFFIGVNEGVIPKAVGSGGIISDAERELLREKQVEMAPTKREAIYTEHFYLYLNLTKPMLRLYLSYCNVGADGSKVKPSYLIGRIQQLFPKTTIVDETGAKWSLEGALGADKGRKFLLEGLERYRSDILTTELEQTMWETLLSWYFEDNGFGKKIPHYIEGVFYQPEKSEIGKAVAKALYGEQMKGSVTRLEQYAACAYAHFLSYGLKIKERQEFKLRMPDLGNIFHSVIELYSKELKRKGIGWQEVSEREREQMIESIVSKVTEEYGNTIFQSSKRNEYMINRIKRIAGRTLWALTEQVKAGSFVPIGYEMNFSFMDDIEATKVTLDGGIMGLTGRIDRVDWMEDENAVYIKVVDYKSGKKAFDIVDLYYGLQMQLVVYLEAAIEQAGKNYPEKEIVPAGIFYYGMDDPVIDKIAEDKIQEALLKELKVNGLVNDKEEIVWSMDRQFKDDDYVDEGGSKESRLKPSVKSTVIPVETLKTGLYSKTSSVASGQAFANMMQFTREKLKNLGNEIIGGKTELNPYQLGDRTACDYCSYKGICGFDKGLGYQHRKLEKKEKEEVWREINGGC